MNIYSWILMAIFLALPTSAFAASYLQCEVYATVEKVISVNDPLPKDQSRKAKTYTMTSLTIKPYATERIGGYEFDYDCRSLVKDEFNVTILYPKADLDRLKEGLTLELTHFASGFENMTTNHDWIFSRVLGDKIDSAKKE